MISERIDILVGMSVYPGARVAAGYIVRGYMQAFRRFDASVRQDDGADAAYFALFEALNWAVAFDDLVREIWRPAGEKLDFGWRQLAGGDDLQDLLNAARYARNLVHHHWADALEKIDGAQIPARLPLPFFTWIWRGASDLPPPRNPGDRRVLQQREAYDRKLAGWRADETLHAISVAFEHVSTFLDPPRPRPPT